MDCPRCENIARIIRKRKVIIKNTAFQRECWECIQCGRRFTVYQRIKGETNG
jgi:transcriptional regulator NrdR family protein